MSTTPVETWAVDLKDVSAIYPMQGWEVLLFLIGVVLWILWHIWQIRHEDQKYQEEIKMHASPENIEKARSGDFL